MFTEHVQTLAKRGKKQVVPEGLYDALIAVVDLLQKMVRHKGQNLMQLFGFLSRDEKGVLNECTCWLAAGEPVLLLL